ncbi:fasciclin domain-containing protein [Carboxylicivirga marina]|uniref:fasciclin domain-containing protein n=1 Tax=Carboxylicivirga marina TaxID=2800988 RepID=UPI002593EEBB|nr:fasciclin domain-containing protein [uncultured Carboxylicivirga sp.]
MKKILLIIGVLVTLLSCEEGEYLIDGGISDPQLGMTTYDYLKSHHQLDTLALLIERGGFIDEVNGASTLFAPNNLSIKNYVEEILLEMLETDPDAEFTVDDIPVETIQAYLGAYIFPEILTRDDLTKEGVIYQAINGEERRLSLEPYEQYGDELSQKPEYVYYTYKVGDDWDPWNGITDDKTVVVRTSNLISTNGVIHVLQGSHVLFNYESN